MVKYEQRKGRRREVVAGEEKLLNFVVSQYGENV
jgi:hypothetical protein